MSYAKKLKSSQENHDVYADIFIDEMGRETGCSQKFLDEARPAIVRLYRDVQGEALETCLDDVRSLIKQQAETEVICARAQTDAKELEKVHVRLDDEIREVRSQIVDMRNTLQATAFSLLGMNSTQTKA